MNTVRHLLCGPARVATLVACAAVAVAALPAFANPTDLANGPLASGVTAATSIKPNIAFIIDDSGSMDDEAMPNGGSDNNSSSCWGWKNYNTLAYDPAYTYRPPYKVGGAAYSDGVTRFPDASFTAALKDGYFPNPGYTYGGSSTSNGTVNLSVTSNLTTQANPKYYYTYPTSSTDNSATTCLADNKYTAVTLSANIAAPNAANGSAAALTNYANWYSYYRKRAYMMKAATSEAYSTLSDQYRAGLFFISSQESGAKCTDNNNGGTVAANCPNHDLNFDDFTGQHRTDFFTSLQQHRKAMYTPLRGALSRIGRMYAGKITGWDPVQYSCQQNFTILSTDGYWNDNWETASYGPLQIDGTTHVGNVDGGATSVVPAKATINIGSGSTCSAATSLTVMVGSVAVQLLKNPPVPSPCTTSRSTLCTKLVDSINNNSAATGFTASTNNNSCSSNKLTITAPVSAGNLTVTPVASWTGTGRTYTISPFSGYAAATGGAPPPYADGMNMSDTLADVAYYYYTTDLRTATLGNCSNTIGTTVYNGLCTNNVFGSGKDVNQQQHMTTFTIGLGASGTITYVPNYESATDPLVTQYVNIAAGTANWPDPINNQNAERIDDLWHAAVNGHGTYYSSRNADTLAYGIKQALSGIASRLGAAAAAATSTLQPISGDNFVYLATYQTGDWYGDLLAYQINPTDGSISTSSSWSAQAQLDTIVTTAYTSTPGTDGRTIWYFSSGATNNLKSFTYANLTVDGRNSYFDNFCSKSPLPGQCGIAPGTLTAAQKVGANTGDYLVKYLRGQSTYEDQLVGSGTSTVRNPNPYYRDRLHVLGDIVNAVPVYLKVPPFTYDKYDNTYKDFKTAQTNRIGTVFAAANDGMLHAFDSNTGDERWAYVPSFVMPKLWMLADKNFSTDHRFLVDGSPTIADVCTSSSTTGCAAASNWKSILIGGLNKGGCGYYALDVTDPTAPKALWEFTNVNLGYSYGNPVVTRRKDGTWVAIVSSGYNNIPATATDCPNATASSDGNGHVFVLDPMTGTLLDDIPTYTTGTTPAGNTATPSGLARLNAWLDSADINIAARLYGGDVLGNVWRIDYDDNLVPAGKEAMRLAQVVTSTGTPQPITTKMELNDIKERGVTYHILTIGTGKYLGTNDPADQTQNTIYGLKDSLGTTPIADVRGSTMVQRTLTQTTDPNTGQNVRTVSGAAVDWATGDGWYIDLNPSNVTPGERVNVDMQLYFNLLTVAANVPGQGICEVGGHAWLYYIDITTGLKMPSATYVGHQLSGDALVAGIRSASLESGKLETIITDSKGGISKDDAPPVTAPSKIWRTFWREIPD